MKSLVFSRFAKVCLFAIVILAMAPAMPAQAHGITAGIAAIIIGSFAIQFLAFPAVILVAPAFRGRRPYFFVPYLIFLAVYYYALFDHLPDELSIIPVIPAVILAGFYAAARITDGGDDEEIEADDPDADGSHES